MAGPFRPLRILGFEPFDTGSHRAVREAITRHSRHRWTWLTRPGRAWKWRMRLAALEFAEQVRAGAAGAVPESGPAPFDAIFATSLLDLGALRAALPPGLRTLPTVLYMHENQAAYPAGPQPGEPRERDVQFALTNLASVHVADLTIWNSRWNRDSFAAGIDAVLRHAPDAALPSLAPVLAARSVVLWPPVEPDEPDELDEREDRDEPENATRPGSAPGGGGAIRIAWPHRWEHDKGPDELLRIAGALTARHNLRWTLLGEQYRRSPPALVEFTRRFADRIDHAGFEPDRAAYRRRLRACDWVLSTARHEFFGIAVVEALFAGCLPWLPDRLSYPELLPACARGLGPDRAPADPAAIRRAVREHLEPALAPNAVICLDRLIDRVIA